MEKKSLSKPMKEILTRIGEFEYIKTIIFPEDVILNVSILFYCHQVAVRGTDVYPHFVHFIFSSSLGTGINQL